MKNDIIKKLTENINDYISGEKLSEELKVSRTAVWKWIKELKKEGYVIESSSKKGYRLSMTPDIINEYEIGNNLNTRIIGREIHCFSTIDSTNIYAKKIAQEGCPEGTLVVADQQTLGRGRLGREWSSMDKKGIWMTVVLRPCIGLEDVQIITLAASVAIVKALKEALQIEAGIKWPNDIILNGKKVCGILTEMSMEVDRVNFLVLGMGINVSHSKDDFEDQLKDKATSLKIFTEENALQKGGLLKRSELIKIILFYLEQIYDNVNNGTLNYIIEEWKKFSVTLGKRVVISYKDKQYEGIAKDITKDGKLVVLCDDGEIREVLSGEISVRGLLGWEIKK